MIAGARPADLPGKAYDRRDPGPRVEPTTRPLVWPLASLETAASRANKSDAQHFGLAPRIFLQPRIGRLGRDEREIPDSA